jgi:hypothetical protein
MEVRDGGTTLDAGTTIDAGATLDAALIIDVIASPEAAAMVDASTAANVADSAADGPQTVSPEAAMDANADAAATAALEEAACGLPADAGQAQSAVLYRNDFETPNMPLEIGCGNSLDQRGINALYGTPSVMFAQVNTVEGLSIHDSALRYSDPSGRAGNYAIGLQTSQEDDLLALTFAATGRRYLNVGLDLSSIEIEGCGGPFGTAAPQLRVSLYDSAAAVFDFNTRGVLLDQKTLDGVSAPDPWTFAWQYGVLGLDASAGTQGHLTLLFDLVQSGYAAIDNLSIVASEAADVVDRNTNGVPDDQECH